MSSEGGKTRKLRRINTMVAAATVLIVAAAVIGSYLVYDTLDKKNSELQRQVAELTQMEKQASVMQHINAQMEEIANEERRISDEQREAAEEQTKVAEQERLNAERERREAETERQNALAAERRAVEASQIAKSQQSIAEQQRAEAELSKRITDTLNYQTVARNLGSAAISQYRLGNNEVADLLAYTAVSFTNRYKGDIYSSTVYQALAVTSQNKKVWSKHKGSVTDVAFFDKKSDDFVSCSTYGEVLRHRIRNGRLQTTTLVSNPQYDFRDVFIDRNKGVVYAISRTSHLLIIANDKVQNILSVNIPKLMHIEQLDKANDHLLLFGEKGLGLFDATTQSVVKVKSMPHAFQCFTRYDNAPLVFDDHGNQYLCRDYDHIEVSRVPLSGQVTAFAESKNQHLKAYGMSDGTINFIDAKGQIQKLKGHRSRISKLKINGVRLYSSSYDGTLNLWMTNEAKIEPMTLFTTGGWIINFTYDPQKTYIWSGDQKGNLTEALISVPVMTERLKGKLKRNLTRDEWAYYVGKNVPYEEIVKR